MLEVLDILANARLVTLDHDTAEVAHEALIREWPTLRAWLDEDRTGLRLHRALASAAQEWERQLRDPDLLYRGARLAQAREWVDSRQADLNPSEIEFLKASVGLLEQQVNERESQRQRELEAARQLATAQQERADVQGRAAMTLRRRAVALGAALLLALCMAGAALFFGAQARQGTALAQANARLATARELAAAATGSLDADPERSILLARQAVLTTYQVDATSTAEGENALHRAVLTSRARLTLNAHAGSVSRIAFAPDGSRVASSGDDGQIKMWDAVNGSDVWAHAGKAGANGGIAFSPDGSLLAVTGDNNTIALLDARSGMQHLTLTGHSGTVTVIRFSPDGTRLAVGGLDRQVTVWDARTGGQLLIGALTDSGRPVVSLAGHVAPITDVAFAPDGARVASAAEDGTIKLWDLGLSHEVLAVASPDWLGPFKAQSPDIDVVQIDVIWPGARAKYLLDLNPTLGKEASQHYPGIIQNNTVDGRLIGMPIFADVGMLYYRTDLLDKYRISAPPATWEELEQQATVIVAGEQPANPAFTGFVYQGSTTEALTCNALEWFASSGAGHLVDGGAVTIDNPAAVAILNRVKSWTGTISPANVTTYVEEDARTAFQTGNAAFMRNWPYSYALANAPDSPIKGIFGVAPLPASPGLAPVGAVGGFQVAVSNYSRVAQAAVELVRYRTSPELQTYRAIAASLVPTMPAVAARADVQQAEPFLAALQGVTRVTRPSSIFGLKYNAASTVIYRGINQILNGQEAAPSLTEVQHQLEQLLKP